MNMSHRVLLVDDHALFRQGLRALMSGQTEFQICGEAADGKSAYDEALAHQPDIVLTDIALPGVDGMQAAGNIKRRMPSVRVVILTSSKSDDHLRQSLKVGVDGYVLKDASYDELIMALRSVVVGKRYLSPDVSGHLVNEYLNPGRSGEAKSPLNVLTNRERSILQLIAEGRSNRTTAEFLSVSTKTVEKHRANLMRKLGLRNSGELMLVAVEMGLISRPGTVSRLVDARIA
jgi:DNA-binding NarL/FixJ family response regulator